MKKSQTALISICTLLAVVSLTACNNTATSSNQPAQTTTTTTQASQTTTPVSEESSESVAQTHKFTKAEAESGGFIYILVPTSKDDYTPTDSEYEQILKGEDKEYITDEALLKQISKVLENDLSLMCSLIGESFVDMSYAQVDSKNCDEWFEKTPQPTIFSSMETLYEVEKSTYSDITTYEDFADKFQNFKFEDGKFFAKLRTSSHLPYNYETRENEKISAYYTSDSAMTVRVAISQQEDSEDEFGTVTYRTEDINFKKVGDQWLIERNIENWADMYGGTGDFKK